MASAYLRFHTDRGYDALNVTLSGTKAKNELDVVQDQVGFYMEDGVSGDEVALCVEAQKAVFPKVTGTAISVGDDVFYDDVNERVNKNTAHRPVGYCIKAAGSAATTVWIRFKQEAKGGTY